MRFRRMWWIGLALSMSFGAFAQEEPPTESEPMVETPPPSLPPAAPEQMGKSPTGTGGGSAATVQGDQEIEVFGPAGGGGSDAESAQDEKPSPTEGATGTTASGKTVPEQYSIQTGDTLWDICQKLLDNPWYWPKLWSLNEYISNPHLIYPGNLLVFFAGSETAPPRMDFVAPEGAPAPRAAAPLPVSKIQDLDEPVSSAMQIKLKPLSILAENEMNIAGKVTHSGETRMHLVTGDPVYLEFKKKSDVAVGDLFHVIEKVKKVSTPGKSFGSLGYMVKRKAVIRIRAIHKRTVEGVIVDCDDTVVRGDRVVPFKSPIRLVQPHASDKMMNGKIVEAENQQFMISTHDYVFLNMGRKQGVDDGLQLVVVRRGDGIFMEDDKKLPYVVFGRLLIVETNENTSTAYVTDLKEELTIGDRVQTRVE